LADPLASYNAGCKWIGLGAREVCQVYVELEPNGIIRFDEIYQRWICWELPEFQRAAKT
jgi:hypothetical protein